MASSLLERKYVNLYYLASKFAFSLLVLTVEIFKNAYSLFPAFLIFLLVAYLFSNFLFLHRQVTFFENRLVRYTDYIIFLLLVALSKNFYGITPAGLLIILYSVLFWTEIFVLTIAGILILLFLSFLSKFAVEDIIISTFYFLSVQVVASKWNLVRLIKLKMGTIQRLKTLVQQLNKELAYKDKNLRLYEEAIEIIEKLSLIGKRENLERYLTNLLDVKSVEIRYSSTPASTPNTVVVRVGNIELRVVPKYPFLLKDRRFKEKLELVAKMAKPYLESFLAKSR